MLGNPKGPKATPIKAEKSANENSVPRNDPILRFFREHYLGVALAALFTAGVAWFTWHVQDCLTRQTQQLEAARTAVVKVRATHQKYMDDLDAVTTRVDIYEKDTRRDEPNLEKHWDALFKVAELTDTDCNAAKTARYDLMLELHQLGRLFSFGEFSTAEAAETDPNECTGWATATERLRIPGSSGLPDGVNKEPRAKRSDTAADVRTLTRDILRNRTQEVRAVLALEELFKTLENEGVLRRVRDCLNL